MRALLRCFRPRIRGSSPVPKLAPARRLTCLRCGGSQFYEAPSTGPCSRVLCAEPACRSWFEVALMLDWVEPLPDDGALAHGTLIGPREIR